MEREDGWRERMNGWEWIFGLGERMDKEREDGAKRSERRERGEQRERKRERSTERIKGEERERKREKEQLNG